MAYKTKPHITSILSRTLILPYDIVKVPLRLSLMHLVVPMELTCLASLKKHQIFMITLEIFCNHRVRVESRTNITTKFHIVNNLLYRNGKV